MESSRLYIKGLPLGVNPRELQQHFSKTSPVTDIKYIPNRGICYVGYRTPADAETAIKYHNKTFIRTSRILIQLARPVGDRSDLQPQTTSANIEPNNTLLATKDANAPVKDTKKRKRDDGSAKLQEFLDVMERPSKTKSWLKPEPLNTQVAIPDDKEQARSALETVSRNEPRETGFKERKDPSQTDSSNLLLDAADLTAFNPEDAQSAENPMTAQSVHDFPRLEDVPQAASDDDWLRSRTSRLLGLLDEDDETLMLRKPVLEEDSHHQNPTAPQQSTLTETAEAARQADLESVEHADNSLDMRTADPGDVTLFSGRLFIRNLAYSATAEELRDFFESHNFGVIEEIHVPLDHRSGNGKGYAYVQYTDPQAARNALDLMDGTSFQGRLLHVIAAAPKKQTRLDEFALSKLPLKKQQQIKRRAQAASSTFNWNSLFMNADAVMSSISERLGLPKAQLLDPTSSDAAVQQAHAETHIIQDTKAYFTANGVNLDAFKKAARGDTTILVKNFSYETKPSDLKVLFESYGHVLRLLVPPSGTIAIVEFKHADDARSAFAGLAYRKVKDSLLFLEKAPRDVFSTIIPAADSGKASALSSRSLLEERSAQEPTKSSTLFVSNLNFSTTTERLRELFQPLVGFLSARVKQKPDPKKADRSLSMGFGFVEFGTALQAQAAIAAINDYTLDGHKLLVRASHKAIDAAELRREEDKAKKSAGRRNKVIIKNLPFEASRKDVRSLLGSYGQLRSVRVPKKFDTSTRGFAFAEFVTAKEAENAVETLKDTHFLGRRLVFEFAAEDSIDPEQEIAKMQKKIGKQANRVALQRLTGTGRKKFNIEGSEEG